MNIEQTAIGIKDAHGLDMSDEAAVMLLRHALSKLAEQDLKPVAYMYPDQAGPLAGKFFVGGAQTGDIPLYTETQLLAAQQRTAKACAKVCAKSDGVFIADVMNEILNGEWREYT